MPTDRSSNPAATDHCDVTEAEQAGEEMQELSRDDIIGHRFTSGRRKGYDPVEVDAYLERLAEYVGRMQAELARHQASERTALEVLQQAQRVADETLTTAQRDAEKLRQNAADGLENARRDARSLLDAASAEADSTLLSARARAESAIEQGRTQIAELEAAGLARLGEARRLVEKMSNSAAECASDFRSAGSRLIEMADQFESEFDALREDVGLHDDSAVELDEPRAEVA
jgi:DivIVA domain-containing protein